MQNKCLPAPVARFLAERGAGELAEGFREKLAALVRFFRENAPAADPGCLTPARLEYLAALLDCTEAMDEQLYEHYRALVDLFRAEVFRLPREALRADARGSVLVRKAVRMGLLPGELYGPEVPRPRIGVPEVYARIREEERG